MEPMSSIPHHEASPPPSPLRGHHAELERAFLDLTAQAAAPIPRDLRGRWYGFERALLGHLRFEERQLLPQFEREIPHVAAMIRREHTLIRAALRQLSKQIEARSLSSEAVSGFVSRLRAHAQREDETLYAWSATHAPAGGWKILHRPLGRASRGVGPQV
jgi:hypothetical protein